MPSSNWPKDNLGCQPPPHHDLTSYQEFNVSKDIFIVNCGTCNNIPFYQKIFSKFKIKYSVICDTDHRKADDVEGVNNRGWDGRFEHPQFTKGIQKSIADQFLLDEQNGTAVKFFVFAPTFEPHHESLKDGFRYERHSGGKVVGANRYWDKIVAHKHEQEFGEISIIKYIRSITA